MNTTEIDNDRADREPVPEAPSAVVEDVDVTDEAITPAGPDVVPASPEDPALKERLLRLQADFDNYRKRSARERSEWQAYALETIVKDLLPVVDHYELGLSMAEKQQADPAVLEGFRLVFDQLRGVLKKNGVTPLSASPGSPYDPHTQEAISHLPSPDFPADTVIAETRKGYMLGERMVRALQVVVSSGPGTDAAADEE